MKTKRNLVKCIAVALLLAGMISLISTSGIMTANAAYNRRTPTPTQTPTSPTSTTGTFGNTNIGAYTDRTPVGDKDSCRYQAPQTATVTAITMYIQTANAQVRYGIYSDNNGKPNQLLAQSSLVSTGNGNSWVSAPVSAPVVAGQYYWLTIVSTSTVTWNQDVGAPALAGNGKDSSTLSPTYGTFTLWGANKFSIYATYTTSASAPSTSTPQATTTATPTPTRTPTPTTSPGTKVQPVWSSNAEISSLSQLGIQYGAHGNGSPNDKVTITTAKAHSGSRSFQLTTDDGRIEFCQYPGSLIQNEFYFSWWEYVPSSMGLPNNGQWLVLFQIEGSNQPGWYPIGKLSINSWDKPSVTLFWQDLNGNQKELANSGVALPRDQWVHFEWYTKIGTSGELACWMNGQKLWDVTGINTSGLKTSTLYYMTALYGMSGTVYVDDLALYNVNLLGKAP
jgi:hypothetical protein